MADYPGDKDDNYKPLSKPHVQDARAQDIVQDSIHEFSQLQTWRNVFASQWEEVAELILPNYRNTFFYGNYNWPGQKKTDRQIDSTGMLALGRFSAICDSLLTPRNMTWHGLRADSDYVMKDRQTQLWFENLTKLLFKYRYKPLANFTGQNHATYQMLGAFGTQAMFVDALYDINGSRGIRYRSVPLGELFLRENHQGLVDGVIRWFRLTARQAHVQFGWIPEKLQQAYKAQSETKYDFIHRVIPRTDYDPDRLDEKGKPFASFYVCLATHDLMSEGGYRSFPYAVSRYQQAPQETYGRGPAMDVLPALKTLNAEKTTFLKQGHRAADPVLLTADDGVVDFSLRPGALNKGGMTADGRPLVGVLPSGNIQISKEMMAEEKSLINDSFLVSLFQILMETPQMTATEVIERTNEKGILLAPTVGRQQDEYLGSMIPREIDLLIQLGLVPPMPPRLREAKGEFSIFYTSPLSRAARAQEAAGFMRTVENSKELVAITQDMSILDVYDFDTANKEIAEIQGVPPSWMADNESIAAKRKNRADQTAKQQAIQAAPAQAAMMKAQAVQAKAGIAQPQPGGQPPQQGPQQ